MYFFAPLALSAFRWGIEPAFCARKRLARRRKFFACGFKNLVFGNICFAAVLGLRLGKACFGWAKYSKFAAQTAARRLLLGENFYAKLF